jgi:hypothetical protein
MAKRKQIDWEKGEKLYRLGQLSAAEIGKQIGCSTSTVIRHMEKFGIQQIEGMVESPVVWQTDPNEKPGFIYVIYLDDTAQKRFYKVGLSAVFTSRLQSHQCSSPFDVCVAMAFFVPNMRQTERILHRKFKDKCVRGEWFELSDDDLAYISTMAKLV